MDAKLACEVDVEGAIGAVDMMDRGEGDISISRRPSTLIQRTAHERYIYMSLEATPSERMPWPVGIPRCPYDETFSRSISCSNSLTTST
jgi:hypothetical protein